MRAGSASTTQDRSVPHGNRESRCAVGRAHGRHRCCARRQRGGAPRGRSSVTRCDKLFSLPADGSRPLGGAVPRHGPQGSRRRGTMATGASCDPGRRDHDGVAPGRSRHVTPKRSGRSELRYRGAMRRRAGRKSSEDSARNSILTSTLRRPVSGKRLTPIVKSTLTPIVTPSCTCDHVLAEIDSLRSNANRPDDKKTHGALAVDGMQEIRRSARRDGRARAARGVSWRQGRHLSRHASPRFSCC